MKQSHAIYFVVRVDVEFDEGINAQDMIDEVQSEMDYSFKYKTDNIEIVSHEICGTQDEW
jgi:hypothetical protein